MYLVSTFGNGPQVNERNLFSLLMFNLSIGCFSILLPSIALRVNDVLLLTGHKMTCFKEVIRMPGAITGRCGSLRKRNAIVHLFAKLVFFSFSKPIKENQNSFLLILFAKEK